MIRELLCTRCGVVFSRDDRGGSRIPKVCGLACNGSTSKETPDERFWAKVDKGPHPKGCWLWTAGVNNKGYGTFNDGAPVYAHIYSYKRCKGAIPHGKQLLHSCDTPRCVNPDHLTPGSNLDNVRDMIAKGRMPLGLERWNCRLSEEQVRAIRLDKRHPALISSEYGVKHRYIRNIQLGRKRRHVV